VIGGLLFSGRAMTLVGDIINADDFYDAKNEAIYAAIVDLDQRSRPVDLITVAEQMRQSGTLSKLAAHGSEAYLAELLNKVATVEEHRPPRADRAGKGDGAAADLGGVGDSGARLLRGGRC
jgi:replicative DNA helicase